jgi:hypothetical protein
VSIRRVAAVCDIKHGKRLREGYYDDPTKDNRGRASVEWMQDYNARMPHVSFMGLGKEGMCAAIYEDHPNLFATRPGRVLHIPQGMALNERGDTIHAGGFDRTIGQTIVGTMDEDLPEDHENHPKNRAKKKRAKISKKHAAKAPDVEGPTKQGPKVSDARGPLGMSRLHFYVYFLKPNTVRDNRAASLTPQEMAKLKDDPPFDGEDRGYSIAKIKLDYHYHTTTFGNRDPRELTQEEFDEFLERVERENDGYVFTSGDELKNRYVGFIRESEGVFNNLSLQSKVDLFS